MTATPSKHARGEAFSIKGSQRHAVRGCVTSSADNENWEPSVLADFDTGTVLDALSLGIIVLDKQLCAIYANVTAQDLLALHMPGMRGRPLAQFLPQPQRFAQAVRDALERGAAVDCSLGIDAEQSPASPRPVNVRIAPLSNQVSGAYVLVELGGHRSSPWRTRAGS